MSTGWPNIIDYIGAILRPDSNFANDVLRNSKPVFTRRGRPYLDSGQFACVFKFSSDSRNIALRCFLTPSPGRLRRYNLLSKQIITKSLPTLVDFDYVEQGVSISGNWFPIIIMDWIEGHTMDVFVNKHLDKPQLLRQLATKWRSLLSGLRQAGVAHGDLQHGNVLIDRSGEIRLVDYDGMYISEFKGEESPEIGNRNYQHPRRSSQYYNLDIDNFAALVIYISLLAIAAEPRLWHDFYTGENLILRREDFEDPHTSRCINLLRKSQDQVVARITTYLERFCLEPPENVPTLDNLLKGNIPPPPPPTILVNSPRHGETWMAGEEYEISWTFTNLGGHVKIDLLHKGQAVTTIISGLPVGKAGTGSYTWIVPDTQFAGNQFSVRITTIDGAYAAASSVGFFALKPPETTSGILQPPIEVGKGVRRRFEDFQRMQCSWCRRFFTNEPWRCVERELCTGCLYFEKLSQVERYERLRDKKWVYQIDYHVDKANRQVIRICWKCGALNPKPKKPICWRDSTTLFYRHF